MGIFEIFDKNFFERLITASILLPIVVIAVFYGGIFFQILIVFVTICMAYEWNEMTAQPNKDKSIIAQYTWKIIGAIYIGLPTISLLWIRDQERGFIITMWLLIVVWITDIAAYLFGRWIGGWKIYAPISSNKTWSGLIAGVISATLFGWWFSEKIESLHPFYLILLTATLSIYAQVGDFVESFIKRKFGAKDSGDILPGHGGILDRVDGIVTVAPKVVVVLLFDKWGLFNQ